MNPSIPVDFLRPIRPLIHFLWLVGLWPATDHTNHRCTFVLYTIYTFHFQLLFTFAYTTFKCVNFLFVTDLSIITLAMFICLTELSLIVKIVNFWLRIKSIQRCLHTAANTVRIEQPSEAQRIAGKLSLLSHIIMWYLITANVTGIFSYMSPLLVAGNDVLLPYPGWYPIDWKTNIVNYWLIYAYQVAGMFLQIQTLVIIEVYFIYLMVAISAQLDIVGERLERIGWSLAVSGDGVVATQVGQSQQLDVEAEAALIDCIHVHDEIRRFADTVEEAGSIPYFVQFIFSGIVLCVSVFQIAIMNPTKAIAEFVFYVGFVLTMLTQIFLPCYFGNEIVVKSALLSRAVYMSNWPERSRRYQKMVLIYMVMLQNPTRLDVGGMFSLTLVSFLSVLNKSYSLYAVLQSFVE